MVGVEQSLRELSRTGAHFRPLALKDPVGTKSFAWLGREGHARGRGRTGDIDGFDLELALIKPYRLSRVPPKR